MGRSEVTFTDPDNRSPRPWVKIVSTPNGSISVWTVRAPSSVTTSPDYARDLNSSEMWAQKKGRSSLI